MFHYYLFKAQDLSKQRTKLYLPPDSKLYLPPDSKHLLFLYKDRPFNKAQWNSHCLLRGLYETHKYTVWWNAGYLGAFTQQFRKASPSVRRVLCVRTEQRDTHQTDFREIYWMGFFATVCLLFQISLHSFKNNRQIDRQTHFTWTPTHIYNISLWLFFITETGSVFCELRLRPKMSI
jgi:hypothetical protein